MTKPIELWVSCYEGTPGIAHTTETHAKAVSNGSYLLHVIEYSAYDKLNTALNLALEALTFYSNDEVYEEKEGTSWETPDGQLQRGFYTQISDHDNNGDKAREALARITVLKDS
jgi:hypothetical protein